MSTNESNQILHGVVLHSRPFGEQDLILTVYTAEHGPVRMMAKSVRRSKKYSVLYAQVFTYSQFTAFAGRSGMYSIDSAEVLCPFYDLRYDLTRLALAQYFAEVMTYLPENGENSATLLKLFLNSLHLLSETDFDETLIKLVFEFNFCRYDGVLPEITCRECGALPARWSFSDGFFCLDHAKERGVPLTESMVRVLLYLAGHEGSAAYAFSTSPENLVYLSDVFSRYLAYHLEQEPESLAYYQELRRGLTV